MGGRVPFCTGGRVRFVPKGVQLLKRYRSNRKKKTKISVSSDFLYNIWLLRYGGEKMLGAKGPKSLYD